MKPISAVFFIFLSMLFLGINQSSASECQNDTISIDAVDIVTEEIKTINVINLDCSKNESTISRIIYKPYVSSVTLGQEGNEQIETREAKEGWKIYVKLDNDSLNFRFEEFRFNGLTEKMINEVKTVFLPMTDDLIEEHNVNILKKQTLQVMGAKHRFDISRI